MWFVIIYKESRVLKTLANTSWGLGPSAREDLVRSYTFSHLLHFFSHKKQVLSYFRDFLKNLFHKSTNLSQCSLPLCSKFPNFPFHNSFMSKKYAHTYSNIPPRIRNHTPRPFHPHTNVTCSSTSSLKRHIPGLKSCKMEHYCFLLTLFIFHCLLLLLDIMMCR